MPSYGIPLEQNVEPNDVGMSFSKGVVTDLLRNKMHFNGYVNTDTGIITRTPWGVEDKTEAQRVAMAIEAGADVLSGFKDASMIVQLVDQNLLSESRINQSVARLLKEQFQLGLFENAYVDADKADSILGNKEFQAVADYAQRKSIVLLANQQQVLPLHTSAAHPVKLYTMGVDVNAVKAAGFAPIAADVKDGASRPSAKTADFALIRVLVSNQGAAPNLFVGGANPDELNFLAFSAMAKAKSWKITPSLSDIQQLMHEVSANKTILAINFRQPFVLDEASGLQQAGGILATFGVSDAALLDVVSGKFNPQGKMPFALANSAEAIMQQQSDVPGYPKKDTLYPFGFGLSY